MDADMSHPVLTKAIANARVKNDAIDAKTLAQLLRTGMLPEAWMAPPEVREARRLIRMRVSLTRMRSRLKAQVHALLAEHGVSNPMSDLFGKGGRHLLDGLRLPELSQSRVDACLRLIDDLGTEIEIADTEILALCETTPGHSDSCPSRVSALPRRPSSSPKSATSCAFRMSATCVPGLD